MSPPPAIETHSLRKEYGDVTAVEDLDLAVEYGEVFGFLGPNGAGKSTTIDVLVDLARPTSGTASVVGYDPQRRPRAVRERVGVLPESSSYRPGATAREHLAFAVAMKRADDDPTALLDRVGLADAADRPVDGFSKGMRKRLGLATALVGRPDLFVLDEPLGGLDPEGARLLREIVREERDRGAAVFFSSHIMDQVETVCDRVGILHDGSLVAVDTVAGLRERVDAAERIDLDVAGVPERHDLETLDGVVDATALDRPRTVRVTCTDPAAAETVVGRLDHVGGDLVGIETATPSLEHVFLALVDTPASVRGTDEPGTDTGRDVEAEVDA